MKRKYISGLSLLVFFLAFLPGISKATQDSPRSRKFEFTYEVTVKNLPSTARSVRIWIPVASSGAHQRATVTKISAPFAARITRDPVSGDRMLYTEIHHPRLSGASFKIVYTITRYAYSKGNYRDLLSHSSDTGPAPVHLVRFLQPDRLVPTDGLIAQIAQESTRGKVGEIEKAYALYNYVFQHMRYDKSGAGWGRGDALWACDAHHGNCTDFHSLFIALARAEKIPARFAIGFPLPPDAGHGAIPGYHCWAEFHVRGGGWTPVDISEAWLTPSKHDFYFGSLDANRVRFSLGRDLTLDPRQDGPPVNYFVYPYVEVDGKPFASVEKSFSFRDLPPNRIAAGEHLSHSGRAPWSSAGL